MINTYLNNSIKCIIFKNLKMGRWKKGRIYSLFLTKTKRSPPNRFKMKFIELNNLKSN